MKIENFEFLKQFKNLEKLAIKNINNFSLEKIDFYLPIKYLSVEKIENFDLEIIKKYKELETISIDRIEADNWENELERLENVKILLNDMYQY